MNRTKEQKRREGGGIPELERFSTRNYNSVQRQLHHWDNRAAHKTGSCHKIERHGEERWKVVR